MSTRQNTEPNEVRFPEIPSRGRYELLIDGKRIPAQDGATFACVDPYENREWGVVSSAGAEDVDRAVAAARAAFDGWRWTPQTQRTGSSAPWSVCPADRADPIKRQVSTPGYVVASPRPAAAKWC
jgi:aldehyde dehydrogenase (NAD+)